MDKSPEFLRFLLMQIKQVESLSRGATLDTYFASYLHSLHVMHVYFQFYV